MSQPKRLPLSLLLAVPLAMGVLAMLFLVISANADTPTERGQQKNTLILEPHCPKSDSGCALRLASGGSWDQTQPLVPGAVLEMDIVAPHPDLVPAGRIQANISYNPTLLHPGEQKLKL